MNKFINVHWARFKALDAWQTQGKLYTLTDGKSVLVKNMDGIGELIRSGNLFIRMEEARVIRSEIGVREP